MRRLAVLAGWLLVQSRKVGLRPEDRGDATQADGAGDLGLVFAALLWSWSGETSLRDRFVQARRICFKALGRSALGTGAAKKARAEKPKAKKPDQQPAAAR